MKHELAISSFPSPSRIDRACYLISGTCSCNKIWWSYKTGERTKKERIGELTADHKQHVMEQEDALLKAEGEN